MSSTLTLVLTMPGDITKFSPKRLKVVIHKCKIWPPKNRAALINIVISTTIRPHNVVLIDHLCCDDILVISIVKNSHNSLGDVRIQPYSACYVAAQYALALLVHL